jgi:hypothetical protein
MKKTILVLTILAIGVGAFGLVDTAYAQQPTPVSPGNGRGAGMGGNGRRGPNGEGTGVPAQQNINLEGKLDDFMCDYLASELGITPDVLKARRDAGESLVAIGLSLGFDQDAVFEMMAAARVAALTQAVADGTITQVQADWLISRLDNRQAGYADGTCDGDCTPTKQQNRRKVGSGFCRAS